jgi:hypothetical protein
MLSARPEVLALKLDLAEGFLSLYSIEEPALWQPDSATTIRT